MQLEKDLFEYLDPTDAQKWDLKVAREAAAVYAKTLNDIVPDGPDKTYLLRKLREVAMWAVVAITRHPDGAPR